MTEALEGTSGETSAADMSFDELQAYAIVALGLAGQRASLGQIVRSMPEAARHSFDRRVREDLLRHPDQRYYDAEVRMLHHGLLAPYSELYDPKTPYLGASLTEVGEKAFEDILEEYESGARPCPHLAEMLPPIPGEG